MVVATPPREVASAKRPEWYSYLDVPPWAGGDPTKPAVEIVNGVRVDKMMGAAETRIANVLNNALGEFLRRTRLGQSYVGMEIELPVGGNCRKPEVAYISEASWPAARPIPDAGWRVCPELAVEVVSPHEITHATLSKVQDYFAAGAALVWLVFPHIRQVYCYTAPAAVRIATPADDLAGDPVIPGFRMRVADLFPPVAATP